MPNGSKLTETGNNSTLLHNLLHFWFVSFNFSLFSTLNDNGASFDSFIHLGFSSLLPATTIDKSFLRASFPRSELAVRSQNDFAEQFDLGLIVKIHYRDKFAVLQDIKDIEKAKEMAHRIDGSVAALVPDHQIGFEMTIQFLLVFWCHQPEISLLLVPRQFGASQEIIPVDDAQKVH